MVIPNGWLTNDPSHSQNRALRQIDDWCEGINTIRAQISDGKRATLQLVPAQLPGPGLLCQLARFFRDFLQALVWHIANNWDQQPGFGIHRHRDVNLSRDDDFILSARRVGWLPISIQHRVFLQSDPGKLHKEVGVGWHHQFSCRQRRFDLFAESD